jgi:hypothetical protein
MRSSGVRRRECGALACGLALLATACSGSPATDGPFGNGGTATEALCDWTPPGGVVTDGWESFKNAGGTATIERVTLVGPRIA